MRIRVALISDTHGLMRPEARTFLRGADRIVHAGDIGSQEVLDELRSIASVVAVRGNNDTEPWASTLPEALAVEISRVRLYVLHDRAEVGRPTHAAHAAAARIIVTGHSHKPMLESHDGRMFVNPGSAGPRRFKLPVAAGDLVIGPRGIRVRIVDLATGRELPGLAGTLPLVPTGETPVTP
jgi:putative phosphoesterase